MSLSSSSAPPHPSADPGAAAALLLAQGFPELETDVVLEDGQHGTLLTSNV